MREAEFLNQVALLLGAPVEGLDTDDKIEMIRRLCDKYQQGPGSRPLPACHIVPFVLGRRPTYEAAYPGLGSSQNTSLILQDSDENGRANQVHVLYQIVGLEHYPESELSSFSLDVSLSFAGPNGELKNTPLPGWHRRPLEAMIFRAAADGEAPHLETIGIKECKDRRLVFTFSPHQDLLPGRTWTWEDLEERIKQDATESHPDPFTFGHLFTQQVYVEIRLSHDALPISTAGTWIEVSDARRLGTLYQRIIERLIKPDALKQGEKAGVDDIDPAHHPWYPVLLIGTEKAALYMAALVNDIVHNALLLTDPKWLLRVGRYLELLTCMGIIEAVKEDVGDLLTPVERKVYETSPSFDEIRRRIDPDSWRRVWELRQIAFPRFGVPRTGPVSAANLLNKRKAILAFLETHHDDLKQAIELAGGQEFNAQESWLRVLRDAERAVLRKTEEAFPELAYLKPPVKDFLLWHRKGTSLGIPEQFSALFGDQDGLYASAGRQYRASMNEVAEWAKLRGLMDYTGEECVPPGGSLLQAIFDGRASQIGRLQRADGYSEPLLQFSSVPHEIKATTEQIYQLLGDNPIFQLLNEDERCALAGQVRTITVDPLERLLVQGREGTSLFAVADGSLEVLVRQPDGVDLPVAVVERGTVIGEMSLLTGAPRSATVRAVDGAVVFEIGKLQYEPIIRARPTLIDELARLMEARARVNRRQSEDYDASHEIKAIGKRIRDFFFSS